MLSKEELIGVLLKQLKLSQESKTELQIATICSLRYQNNYTLSHIIPKTIPPSYDMKFTFIHLATIKEDVKTRIMNNMSYEVYKKDKILLHYRLKNGEMILAIRRDNDENKTSETDIIVTGNTLTPNQGSSSVIKRGRVLNIAFYEPKNMFAILFEDRLEIAALSMGNVSTYRDKQCNLSVYNWFDKDRPCKALLMQEYDNKIYVWLIDHFNVAHAFNTDTLFWETSKVKYVIFSFIVFDI